MSQYSVYPKKAGGGGGSGTVTSVGLTAPASLFTVTNSPITSSGSLHINAKTQTANTVFSGPVSGAAAAPAFRALVLADIPIIPVTGNANTFAGFNGSGDLEAVPGFNIDVNSGGLNETLTEQPNDLGGGYSGNSLQLNFDPLQDSPDDSWNIYNIQAAFDVNSSGFTQGTSGTVANILNVGANHEGTGDIGGINVVNTYVNLGNGTDPIDVKGILLHSGFADINSGVTMSANIQGYNFQPHIHPGAVLQNQILAYADFTNVEVAIPGYQSFISNPNISEISNNSNFVGFSTNPDIATFSGNAGFTGLGIFGNLGTFGTGDFQGVAISPNIDSITNGFLGINISPTITLNNGNAVGLEVSVDNVTNFAGVKASLVVQDITYQYDQSGTFGNTLSVEYLDTATAGSEVASLVGGNQIQVTIESGVSTATQVRTALLDNPTLSSNLTFPITGTGSNAQVTYGPTSLAGGVSAGTKKAAQFDGDVSINGALSFTGSLAIGALSSFATFPVISSAGVASVDTLITNPTVAASATITGTDLLAINTAMLLSIGDNASVTSSFLGFAALGLPAVVTMGTGSTIDLVEGAVFAISLDAGATGGTIGEVDLCRSLAIPNGATTVTKLKGYAFDLPFGDPATTTWGFYATPTSHNYFAGDLLIGGTAGSVDTVANSSVGLELNSTTKAILSSRMTSTQRDALTAVNGMVLYNTTTDKLQVYAAGAWVDLH